MIIMLEMKYLEIFEPKPKTAKKIHLLIQTNVTVQNL